MVQGPRLVCSLLPFLVSIGNVNLVILQATMQKFNPSPRCSAAKEGESLICPLYVYPIVLSLAAPFLARQTFFAASLAPDREVPKFFVFKPWPMSD